MDSKVTHKDQMFSIDGVIFTIVNTDKGVKVFYFVGYNSRELTRFDIALYRKVAEVIRKGEYPMVCFSLYNYLKYLFIEENAADFTKQGVNIKTMNSKSMESAIFNFYDSGKIENKFAPHVINYDDYRLRIQNCILKIDPFFDNHILYTAEGTYAHVKNLDANTLGTVVDFIMQPEYEGKFTTFKNYMQRLFNLCHPNQNHPYR